MLREDEGKVMKIRCMNCMKEYDSSAGCCPVCGFVRGTPPKEICHLYPEVVLAERYIVGTVVAYGGFGILYRAWDMKLQVMVAVKEYFPSNYVNRNPGEKEIFIYTSRKQGEFQDGLKGFLDEARNTAKFSSHPNIVNVYDYFQENGTAYMVMEYMDGITLKQYTKQQGGKLSWQQAVEILTSICDDLQVVHEAGILHRDISPDNIMLCKDGTIKLFDFGAARFSDVDHEVTRTIILKIGFAPPEQYRAKSRQGAWTDIYALGATLYRTITGILPDESVNRQESLLKDKKDTLVHPKALVPEIPDYLDIAICRAMAIQPELRFKNTVQLKDALLNRKQYVELEKELDKRKKRRKLGIGLVTAAAAAGIAGCIFYYQSRQNQTMLKGAGVTVWVPVKEGEDVSKQQALMDSMLEEFRLDYPEVSIDVSCMEEAAYEDRLAEAARTGEGFPTLYESTRIAVAEDRKADLSEVLELVDSDEYYGLDRKYLGETKVEQIPLGMHMAVVYVNTQMTAVDDGTQNDMAAFLNGECRMAVADSGDYTQVQAGLPGIYSVVPLPKEQIIACYDRMWSVDSKAKSLDQEAAKRILYYFLGETTQDVLYLQNEGALPVNKNEFETYLEINQELSFLKEQLDAGAILNVMEVSEYQARMDSCYTELLVDDQAMAEIEEQLDGGEE